MSWVQAQRKKIKDTYRSCASIGKLPLIGDMHASLMFKHLSWSAAGDTSEEADTEHWAAWTECGQAYQRYSAWSGDTGDDPAVTSAPPPMSTHLFFSSITCSPVYRSTDVITGRGFAQPPKLKIVNQDERASDLFQQYHQAYNQHYQAPFGMKEIYQRSGSVQRHSFKPPMMLTYFGGSNAPSDGTPNGRLRGSLFRMNIS